MFKVLITGAKGQVGAELVQTTPADFTVIALGSKQLDITNLVQVKAVVTEHQPDLIINAAAYTAVDKAESDIEQAYAVNEKGVEWLARAAEEADIPLFHISTDYVFDGQASQPYKETDSVNPKSVYGASKLAGEQVLAKILSKHIILRTSWVFGAVGNNFVKTMLRLGKERDELSVVSDQYGCPTSASSIANILWLLVVKYIQEKSLPWGIYHFSNSPACTWHEFACKVFEQAVKTGTLNKAPLVKAITTADYPTPAKRPAWSVLSSRRVENLLGVKGTLWKTELKPLLQLIKASS